MRFAAVVIIEVPDDVIKDHYEDDTMAARVDFLDGLNNWSRQAVEEGGYGKVINAWTRLSGND